MSEAPTVDPILDSERLARFIVHPDRIRADMTIKPEAFMPPNDLELSVTRHQQLGERGIWERARPLVESTGRSLVGRADIRAESARQPSAGLDVVAAPLVSNPQHAHIVGWPPSTEKSRQKMIAIALANDSKFVLVPK